MDLTILMPSLNEEDSIGETIDSIPFKRLNELGYKTEVLVVDGGSRDKTRKIAGEKGAKVVQSLAGYGLQYRIGFRKAGGKIIVTADSDCSYPMEKIPYLLDIFQKQELDFITANRFGFMEKGAMKIINRFGNKILTFFLNFLFHLDLKDSQSGMWVLKKEALKKLSLTSRGMSLSQEIKIEAFTKLKAKEVDLNYKKRKGEVKLKLIRDGFDNFYNLFKKKFK